MEAISKLFLLSNRKELLNRENQILSGRINRLIARKLSNLSTIVELEKEAEILNGELKEQQIQNYKFGKA